MSSLYRKYRPQTFADLIAQDHVKQTIQHQIAQGTLAHAYLFMGPRGVGKTTTARLIAKAFNCQKVQYQAGTSRDIIEPCNVCSSCVAITGGHALDVMEIDAASNTGVDHVREHIIDAIRFIPHASAFKVFIIDEVHMLSSSAFNALLKTLEEPPAHAVFILATTEIHKIPETIISRCQVFTFKKPTEAVLRNLLGSVAEKEEFELDAGSAELLAILADGSFRDALGELQKILNFSKNKKIKREDVEKLTGAPKATLVNDYISAIAENDLEKGISAVRAAAETNLDMKLYFKLIIQKFRAAIILRYAPKLKNKMTGDLGEADLKFLEGLVKEDKDGMLRSQALATLLGSYQDMDNAFIAELPLELALVRIISKE